ncbi:MAG: insulinase family protein, partial [Planctomycetes bacterium]|nr:insulinase family protein [Planctomycetota bacterium]
LGRTLTQERLDLQRAVVRNERRQSYEMRPYGQTWLVLGSMIYPEGHPYRHPVIGNHADLEAASLHDVRTFFDTWYVPANASLCVAGDFEASKVRALIERLFADIPNRPMPERQVALAPALAGRVERTLHDDVPAPGVVLAWPSPPRFSRWDAEMDLVGDLLAEGAASRLEQALLHRRTIAQGVEASQVHGELASEFVVEITALPGVEPGVLENAVREEIATLARDGPTPGELNRLITLTEADFIRSKQELLERTDDLNLYLSALGEPDRLEWDLDRYRAVSVDSMREAIAHVLDLERHASLRIVPGERTRIDGDSIVRSEPDEASSDAIVLNVPHDVAPTRPEPWTPPVPRVHTRASRHEGWHIPSERVPLAVLSVIIPLGAEHDPVGQEGRSALLAEFMTEAAGGRDAEALDAALDSIGAELSVIPHRGAVSINVSTLARHLDASCDILADVLLRPEFLAEDLERVREITLAEIAQRERRPEQVATLIGIAHVLGHIPGQGHPVLGEATSVASMTRNVLLDAHGDLVAAASAARWVAAGAIDGERIADTIASRLPRADPTAAPDPIEIPPPGGEGPLEVLLVDRPGAPQTFIRMLRRCPCLGNDELPALELANAVVGGTFLSRLNNNLRERHGFTYGAGSTLWAGARSGLWTASSSVHADVTARAVDQFLRELRALGDTPPTAEERDRVLAMERAHRVRAMENLTDVVATLAPWAEAERPPDAASRFLAALGAVTLDDMAEATRWMTPTDGVLVLVGDAERIIHEVEHVVPVEPRII